MKKKTIPSVFALVAATVAATLGVLFCVGCDGTVKHETVMVTTVAELKAVDSDSNVTLGADIDCGNGLVDPIECHGFDGNGYTISNAIVNGASFFDAEEFIKNVTLDNVTVNSQNNRVAAFVQSQVNKYIYENTEGQMFGGAAQYKFGVTIENVHVKNSTLTVTNNGSVNVGGMIGYEDNDHGFQRAEMVGNVVTDCTVTKCVFEVHTDSGSATVGGIYGADSVATWDWNEVTVSNCSVSDCKLYVDKGMYVGGLFGSVHGTFTKCHAENNSITAIYRTLSNGNVLVPTTGTGLVYTGSMFGRLLEGSTARLCYAENNRLYVASTARYRVGGLVGVVDGRSTVDQCYACDTQVKAQGRYESDKSPSLRHFGGLIGYADGGIISSCFAAGANSIIDNDKPSSAVGEERNYGGFIGGVGSSVTVQYCAATGLDADETAIVDRFCPTKISGLVVDCYADGGYGNVNDCATIAVDDWLMPNTIKSMLNLLDPAWDLTTGKMPKINA